MATLTIRNLSEATRQALKERAARNNQSMEAEVRAILGAAVGQGPDFVASWLSATERLRGEFDPPDRSYARSINLT